MIRMAAECPAYVRGSGRMQRQGEKMHRFFASRLDEETAILAPDENTHAVKVLRLKAGDPCQIILEESIFEAEITATVPDVTVRILAALPSPEPSVRVTLYQGLPKGDKMDYIAQKCTEAGISRIVPVLFKRCVTKWDARDGEKKRARWQRIAQEAAKQSGRAAVPQIGEALTVKGLCAAMAGHDLILSPWEEAKRGGIGSWLNGQKDVAVIIGPEGGIDPEEMAQMQAAGAVPVTLGPRILRTETAGLAALVSLLTLTGDME